MFWQPPLRGCRNTNTPPAESEHEMSARNFAPVPPEKIAAARLRAVAADAASSALVLALVGLAVPGLLTFLAGRRLVGLLYLATAAAGAFAVAWWAGPAVGAVAVLHAARLLAKGEA